jgi:hypothetical protein
MNIKKKRRFIKFQYILFVGPFQAKSRYGTGDKDDKFLMFHAYGIQVPGFSEYLPM